MKNTFRKFMTIIAIISLMATTMLTALSDQTAQAAFTGGDGAVPGGGTSDPDGGVCQQTIYRVGVTNEQLSSDNYFEEGESNEGIIAKIKKHYEYHMPSVSHSVMFVPSGCYTKSGAMVGWYNTSTGQLIINPRNLPPSKYSASEIATREKEHDMRVRELVPAGTNPHPDGLFYNALSQQAPAPDSEISNLTVEVWKKIVNDTPNAEDKSYKVWNYLLGNKAKIDERIKAYIGEDLMNSTDDKDVHKARLKYLDLLLTIYAMVPDGDYKNYYTEIIERYIQRKDLEKKPIMVSLDSAARFSSPAILGNNYIYIPSSQYLKMMHGITPKTDFTSTGFKPSASTPPHSTKDLLLDAARQAMKEQPNRPRYSDDSSGSNGFTRGYTGVTGFRITTNSKAGTATYKDSNIIGVMESMIFHGNAIGFMIAGGRYNLPEPGGDCACSQQLTIPNKSSYEGKLPTNTVSKQIPLIVSIKQNDDEKLKDWENLLDRATDLQVKVDLTRSTAPGTPIWINGGNPAPGEWTASDAETIIGYLKGTTINYSDDLMNYTIADEENVTFTYNVTVTIKGKTRKGKDFEIACTDGAEQVIKMTGPDKPCDCNQKGNYSSTPSFYSEIKQGSPGNETFEAMAGTPTTRSLYFATGGSEFIVDVEVEYVPDMTSTRTYRSYFTGGVPSEFKIGDQAKNYTVPSPSGASSSSLTVNGHTGGTVSASWTGEVPYIGNLSCGDHFVSGADKWDRTAYNAALAQASAWASAVNGFTVTHTAASDGETRSFNSWGAGITSNSISEPAGSYSIGQDYIPPSYDGEGNMTSPGQPYVPTTCTPGTTGSYSITVTGKMPAQIIDGPSSTYDLPMVEDTWTQTITYDYTKITKAKVWKIEKSKVDGMDKLTPSKEITASIVQGDPTIFYNIANENRLPTRASEEGRLRFSLEPDQHDVVVWNEGPRTNKDDGRGKNLYISGPGQSASWATGTIYTNNSYSTDVDYHVANSTAKDKNTVEYKKFDERRKSLTNVTAVSDFLILQTSSGDQSVMYFEKTIEGVPSQNQADIPKTSFDEQWTDNAMSAAKWTKDQINIGSYNGKFATPELKYSSIGSTKVATIFDTLPAGKVRPARPSAPLRLVQTGIPVNNVRNGEYITGVSNVFYKTILNEPPSAPTIYPNEMNDRYKDRGVDFDTTYSPSHGKVNDIVIHNPVSTEYAFIYPIPDERDQRTRDSKLLGGNLQPPTIRYEKRLKPGYVFTPRPPVYEKKTVPNPDYIPPKPGTTYIYPYTGSVQTFTAEADGIYTLEVWGAQGSGPGGLGGYSKGKIHLTKNQTLYIYVGGMNGYNGGGAAQTPGGGGTDIRTVPNDLHKRIIVAGGGGGNFGGSGGGLAGNDSSWARGGTQTSGGAGYSGQGDGAFGIGGAGGTGGGGGWYGGGADIAGSVSNTGAGGGSGYIGGVSSGTTTAGVRTGNGEARITTPDIPGVGTPTIEVEILVDPGLQEPPEDAYEYIPIVIEPSRPITTPTGTFPPGRFINLDYPFEISFPNKGDFYGNGAHGIASTSAITGKGFTDYMDTTEWTASKQVKFEFFVIYNGVMYSPGQWIDLEVHKDRFQFYVPLANSEAISALVEFRAIANNANYPDGKDEKNKVRHENLAADHSALKRWNVDVVGRIGGLVLEDTGDFRFSNLFKQPLTPTQWLVPNVVKKVDVNKQNHIVGDGVDVRGEKVSASTHYLNTYGLLPHLQQLPIPLPLSSEKNNISALQRQPMRLGYNVLADIQTIGNYYDTVQIIPYYYSLDLTNGSISPVDIYMEVNNEWKPINKFGAAVPGWDPSIVYPYTYTLDWMAEAGRRNYTEAAWTDSVVADSSSVDEDGVLTTIGQPHGGPYPFGTAQIMFLTERNRTFIGTDKTYGMDKNPGGRISPLDYGKQGQRWHFTYGLPSSAVAVKQGQAVTQENIDAIRNNHTVLIVALDIKSSGTTYVLQYSRPNGSIHISGTSWSLASIPYPVVSVYSAHKSSADDLAITGTH